MKKEAYLQIIFSKKKIHNYFKYLTLLNIKLKVKKFKLI